MNVYFIIPFVFSVLLGAFTLSFRIYKMTELDARSRGLKHPKFWGFFTMSGNNSGGILLYLIGRRQYPSSMSESDRIKMDSHKKKAAVSIIFLAIGSIGAFIIIFLNM